MDDALRRDDGVPGLLRIEDCLDADGGVALPPGVNLISLIDRNIANVGDTVAYRYLDYSGSDDGTAHEVTWSQFGVRLEAIGARIQQVASRGERVAVLAPQGIDYVAGFYAAVKASTIAVPLFARNCPGMPSGWTRRCAIRSPASCSPPPSRGMRSSSSWPATRTCTGRG